MRLSFSPLENSDYALKLPQSSRLIVFYVRNFHTNQFMSTQDLSKAIVKSVLTLVGIAALAYGIYLVREVIAYVIIAAVLSLIGKPLVKLLTGRLKVPNTLAVALTLTAQLFVFFGLIGLLVPVVITQGEQLSLLNVEDLSNRAFDAVGQLTEAITAQVPYLSEKLDLAPLQARLLSTFDLDFIPSLMEQIGAAFGSFSVGVFSILFLTFFFLKDQQLFRKGVLTLIPDHKEAMTLDSIDRIEKLLSRYFVGILIQLTILLTVYAIALAIGGVQHAFTIAFLCAIFNIIPYIGPLIGAFLMLLLTLIGDLNVDFMAVTLPKLFFVLGGVVVGQLIDNFFSQPFIYAKSVKSHPIEIFLVILCSGLLFGVVGLIIAVPLYTSIKVILKVFYRENYWVEKLTKNL